MFKTQHNVALKGWRRRFNSVPGHHFFNEVGEILKPPSPAKKPSIVGGNNALGERRPAFISLRVIDLLLCDASKRQPFIDFAL
jgi:hypothetical protein